MPKQRPPEPDIREEYVAFRKGLKSPSVARVTLPTLPLPLQCRPVRRKHENRFSKVGRNAKHES